MESTFLGATRIQPSGKGERNFESLLQFVQLSRVFSEHHAGEFYRSRAGHCAIAHHLGERQS